MGVGNQCPHLPHLLEVTSASRCSLNGVIPNNQVGESRVLQQLPRLYCNSKVRPNSLAAQLESMLFPCFVLLAQPTVHGACI